MNERIPTDDEIIAGDVTTEQFLEAVRRIDEIEVWVDKIEDDLGDSQRRVADLERQLAEHKRISFLIGSIFYHGGFVAETQNERDLAALMRKTGYFFEDEESLFAARPDTQEES